MYNPSEIVEEVSLVESDAGYYWVRLQDISTGEIQDIPIEPEPNSNVVSFWIAGAGNCDCVRYRTFYRGKDQNQNQNQNPPDYPCGHERIRLLGIWDRTGYEIHHEDV